jgi:hypothetical protein
MYVRSVPMFAAVSLVAAPAADAIVTVQAAYTPKVVRAGLLEDSIVDSFRATLKARTAAAYANAAVEADAAAGLALVTPLADASRTKAAAAARVPLVEDEESDVTPEGSSTRLEGRWQRSLSEVGLRSSFPVNPSARIARTVSFHR